MKNRVMWVKFLIPQIVLLSTMVFADISGTVYKDLAVNGAEINIYGVKNSNENGIAGVTVTAYPSGVSTKTKENGSWNLATSGKVRVEFSDWSSYLQESPDANSKNTSVQFVDDGAVVYFGLHDVNDYSTTATPDYVTNIFVNGDGDNDRFNLVSSGYLDNGLNQNFSNYSGTPGTGPVPTTIVKQNQIGTVWGIDTQVSKSRIYAASLLKRHSGFNGNTPSTIFYTDYTGTTVNHFDLQGIIPANGSGAIDLGSVNRPVGDLGAVTNPNNDNDAYAKVGKMSYGDLEFDNKNETLWVVNLFQRAIISVDAAGINGNSVDAKSVKQYTLDSMAGMPTCTGGTLRPWAFAMNNGRGYIGAVCDAFVSQDINDLKAHVVSFDLSDPSVVRTEVSYALGYDRAHDGATDSPSDILPSFFAWNDEYHDVTVTNWDMYNQPMLTGIEFDKDNNMYLAFLDRYGLQIGFNNKNFSDGSVNESGKGMGEMRKVCLLNGVYKVEGTDAACPHNVFSPDSKPRSTDFFDDIAGDNNANVDGGAVATIKGNGQIMRIVNDPHPQFDRAGSGTHEYWVTNGTQTYSLESGKIDNWYSYTFDTNLGYSGKASGMGDVEFLTAKAPIEIGNLIWLDTDGNGVQNAEEEGIAGITVELVKAGIVVATATTDINGHYIFSNDTEKVSSASHIYTVSQLDTQSDYIVRVPNVEGADKQKLLGANTLTLVDVGEGAHVNINDSDGVLVGNHAEVHVSSEDIPSNGTNNHIFDFGFKPDLVKVSIGSIVWNDANNNGIQDATEIGIDGAKVQLLDDTGTPIVGVDIQTTVNGGTYFFAMLSEGSYRIKVTPPAGYSPSSVQVSDPNSDIPSDSNIETDNGDGSYTSGIVVLSNDAEPFEDAESSTLPHNGDDADNTVDDNNGNMTVDFGFYESGSWSGNVSKDTNNDDIGEEMLSGVSIELFADSNGDGKPNGAAVASTTTDAQGNYSFTGLIPGDYVAVETQPAGLLNVKENEGGADNDKADNGVINMISGTVDAGENDAKNDFVEEEPGSWSGNVSKDTNNDDIGEEMLSGVSIELFADSNGDGKPNGAAVASTTTDAQGNYSFTGLIPGDYVAVETQPAGLLNVKENEGGADNDKADNGVINMISGTVDAGENDAKNDFVEEEPGRWSGNVSKDTNNDDIGEENLAGVTIELFTDPNGDGNPADGVSVGTTTTDANGNYSFTGLTPGDYVAVETQPAGLLDVSENEGGADNDKPDNVTLNAIAGTVDAGENDTNNDFVEEEPGAISGNVSKDNDNDNAGDENLAGVTIELFTDTNGDGQPDGAAIATTTTDANGNFIFPNLAPGDYVVVETQPAGLDDVSENEGGVDNDKPDNGTINSIAATVDAGETDTNNDFVEEESGSWSGNVSKDTNNDDTGDENLAGVTIELFTDPNGDGNPADGVSVGTTTTDANGNYSFTGLTPGDYVAVETQPAGLLDVSENEGGADNDENGVTPINTISGSVNAYEHDSGNDFVEEAVGSLTGNVSHENNNGLHPMQGVVITLHNPDGSAVLDDHGKPLTIITDSNGNYEFINLVPADYIVREEQPDGFFDVRENEGGFDDDNTTTTGVNEISATVGAGENDINNDFVEAEVASLGDLVWYDTNNDGIQDSNETGVDSVRVYLLDANGDRIQHNAIDIFTETNSTGEYLFEGLNPLEEYAVEFDLSTIPNLYEITTQDNGNNDIDDSDADHDTGKTVPVILAAGEHYADLDMGIYAPTAHIGDYFWIDRDQNGIQNPGEEPVTSAMVELFDENGDPVTDVHGNHQIITDADGKYGFDVPPGTYQVRFTIPEDGYEGYIFSSEDQGGDDASDTDVNNKGFTQTVTVAAGQNNLTLDAGINCGCANASIKSNGGDTLGLFGILSMMFMTLMTALLFVRKEDEQRN